MPIITQKRYYRSDLQNNPNVIYVFGDNDERDGFGGQAAEARGEPNALGVRTKWAPNLKVSAFFNDIDYVRVTKMIQTDLAHMVKYLDEGRIVVLPEDGLGTGFSELEKRAPRINAYLEGALELIKRKYASRSYTSAEVASILGSGKLADD